MGCECVCEREREKGRERDRDKERERQRDIEREGEGERQGEAERDRNKGWQGERERNTERDRERETQIERDRERWRERDCKADVALIPFKLTPRGTLMHKGALSLPVWLASPITACENQWAREILTLSPPWEVTFAQRQTLMFEPGSPFHWHRL